MRDRNSPWEAGNEDGPVGGLDLGTPHYGEGRYVNDAFSLGTVFQAGFAMLVEQPVLVLLAGLNMMVVALLPTFVQLPISAYLTALESQGQLSTLQNQFASQLTSLGVSVMFFPINQLIAAGIYVACAYYVKTGEVSLGTLYSSVRPALNGLLYTLVASLVGALVGVAALSPSIALLAVAVGSEQFLLGILALPLGVVGALVVVYVNLGLLPLGVLAAVLDGRGPVEAMQISWSAASGARVTLFILQFAFGLLSGLAACMCFVPLIPVAGIQLAGLSAAWMVHSRHDDETSGWRFVQEHIP